MNGFQMVTQDCQILVNGYEIETNFDVAYPSK